jgi:integrase
MKSNYDSVIKQLVKFSGSKDEQTEIITPDSLVEWAGNTEPEEILDLLNNFERWLQGQEVEGYSKRVLVRNERFSQPNTASQKAHGIARGFFTHNKVWLPKGRKSNGVVPKTKTNDNNYAIFKYDGDAQKVVQEYTQLRYFLSNLSFRDQTVALCLLSSSQDVGDLLALNIDWVKLQSLKDRLYWTGTRTKTGEIFKTFFSKEATKYIRQYISQERSGAEGTEPIFVRTNGGPLLVRNVSSTFKDVAKKMGIDNGEAQNPFRPKRLRSIFSTACYEAKIDDGARHIFMGHSGSVSENYRELPVANLEGIYAQVEPFLTVYAEDNSQEIAKSISKSQQALDLALDLREQNKKLQEDMEHLREVVEGLNSYIDMLKENTAINPEKIYEPVGDEGGEVK